MDGDKIVCFGEVLWDVFQFEKKLGGAPYNVVNSLKRLGADVNLISRIGDDQLGKEMISWSRFCVAGTRTKMEVAEQLL